jgi:hypothetical protein
MCPLTCVQVILDRKIAGPMERYSIRVGGGQANILLPVMVLPPSAATLQFVSQNLTQN